jgi:uncharacterized membrane protein YphA (DoxX/SURF4 family)
MKTALKVTRVIVGVLFIFSGLIKANDPLGLSYKMQEFFEVWNFHLLDHYTLALSTLMIVAEIIAGVAVLLGWQMKIVGWFLLLLILFFSFLTGYAFLSGKIRECGCFGNCIPLTAKQSFIKDLFLLALIIYLFIHRKRIEPLVSNVTSWSAMIIVTVFSFSFQWFALQHMPVFDCLPFKRGANIEQQMKVAAGAVTDSTVITFVYSKNGKETEFTADRFPADFDDSYKFIRRYDRLVRKGNAEPAIKDFVLINANGTDTTMDVLNQKGYKLFMFIRELTDRRPAWDKEFGVIITYAKAKNIPVFYVTSDYDAVYSWLKELGLNPDGTVLKSDATAIKTAARTNPTLYLVKKSTILQKWSHADFDQAILDMNTLPDQSPEQPLTLPSSSSDHN